jgi:hypothetical protein
MSYKFNRNCWVESVEERLFCDDLHGDESSTDRSDREECGPAEPATIEAMIESAQSLFARWGEELRQEERICRLIRQLETDLENSRHAMHDLGIFRACARCDATAPAGSCCSRGLERKYSPILLVMNLMLGTALPERRLREDSCYFLGSNGCGLKVRHMLCVDYLCPELERALGGKSLIEIQTVSGEEIRSAFLLREAVKKTIQMLLQQENA